MKKYVLSQTASRTVTGSIEYDKLLDDEQRRVVFAGEGPKLVIAGAGSGKTRAITYRVARLVETGVRPQSIMLLTFTNKAAREMTRRVETLLPNRANGLWAGTFHHIGNRLLRRFGSQIGLDEGYTILDSSDAVDIMKMAISEVETPQDRKFPKAETVLSLLSLAINTGNSLEETIKDRDAQYYDLAESIISAARQYAMRKLEMRVLDFDDLLLFWRVMLQEKKEILELLREQFRYILVDEYQDTNRLQGEIIDAMAGESGNITVVGDDSQSIYSFRGADFSNIIEFPERHSNAEVFYLTRNYRSTPEILNLANKSISFNTRQFPKTLIPVKKSGNLPALVPAKDVYEQAAFIAEHIIRLTDEGVPLKEIGVLYRSHADSMEIQMELTRRRIPYLVRSGLRFFETAHIKDVIAFLRFMQNSSDELSFMRAIQLFKGIGARTASRFWAVVKEQADPIAFIVKTPGLQGAQRAAAGFAEFKRVISRLYSLGEGAKPGELIAALMETFYEECLTQKFDDYTSRKLDIEQLASFAAHFNNLRDFLSELSLLQTIAAEDTAREETAIDEYLVLSSIHQAKGLEWKALFIAWCADGRLPLERCLINDGGEEEERRLFYVAVTRAKEELYLCYPLCREERGGFSTLMRRSRFIDEIPAVANITETWALEAAPEDSLPLFPEEATEPFYEELPAIQLDERGERTIGEGEAEAEAEPKEDDEIPF